MICEICGKEFSPSARNQKYCGTECGLKANRERQKAYRENTKSMKEKEVRRNAHTRKKKLTISDINAMALKEGLSYGKFIGKYGL